MEPIYIKERFKQEKEDKKIRRQTRENKATWPVDVGRLGFAICTKDNKWCSWKYSSMWKKFCPVEKKSDKTLKLYILWGKLYILMGKLYIFAVKK